MSNSVSAELADLPSDAFDTSSSASPVKTTPGRFTFSSPINRQEPPTHHKLDDEATKTWIFPTNLGSIRDYQYNIAVRGLFHNLLVALPTGLGKTFIAATIMLNWFRWTRDSQIVFVAPTKPLVSQQIDACLNLAGIPRSQTTMLTGEVPPSLREDEWSSKRVFFMTPQTIVNDLKKGIADPKRLVLLVVDEAHRATGGYAYVEVVRFVRRFNPSFRVLALTATPGSDVESVQQVIDGLDISRAEIRTEQSIDIRQYIHSRQRHKEVFENSQEMEMLMDLYSTAVQPVLNVLTGQNAYWSRDPVALTAFGLTKARQQWSASPAGRNAAMPVKGMVNTVFTILSSLAHSMELLKYHGIEPFYHKVLEFEKAAQDQKSKYRNQILESEHWKKMMVRLKTWTNNPEFVGHPKLEHLRSVILNHLMDAGESSGTRIMVFAHFRDSAENIVRILKRNQPMIRPHVFVGQATSKDSEGMGQKQQLEVIEQFRKGTYNTLVATSIGEEGLDIGEIDLIICYDSKASPIRMLQRMGRTGRKRAGKIVLLQMKGKEEDDYEKAKDAYKKIQGMIADGKRFRMHEDRSRRILPRETRPTVDKRVVEIPVENSQHELPIPTQRGKAKRKKAAPKKFHMPDGVETGFFQASRFGKKKAREESDEEPPVEAEPEPFPLPALEEVLLTPLEEELLDRRYMQVHGDDVQVASAPILTEHPERQRRLGRTKYVRHGQATLSVTSTVNKMHSADPARIEELKRNLHDSHTEASCFSVGAPEVLTESENESEAPVPTCKPSPKRRKTGRFRNSAEALEAESSSPPQTAPEMRLPTQGIDLGSQDSSNIAMEDEELPDSELAAFVANDSEPIDAAPTSSLPPSSLPLNKPFYVSQEVASDDEEEDLPEVSALTKRAGSAVPGKATVVAQRDTADRRKRRRRVVDSDEDEDEDDDGG